MSSLFKLIEQDYREYLALSVHNQDLKDALKYQERTPLFYQNLARELSKVKGLKRETIRTCVYDMTEWFIKNVERLKQEAHMTAAHRAMLLQDQSIKQTMRKALDVLTDDDVKVITHGE